MADFALKFVIQGIKRGFLDYDAEKKSFANYSLAQVEPLVILIMKCFESTHNAIISNALKVMNLMLKMPFQIIARNTKRLTSSLLKILGINNYINYLIKY